MAVVNMNLRSIFIPASSLGGNGAYILADLVNRIKSAYAPVAFTQLNQPDGSVLLHFGITSANDTLLLADINAASTGFAARWGLAQLSTWMVVQGVGH